MSYFGIGVENIKYKQNLGTLWRSAINLGADYIFTIGSRYKHQSSDTVKAFRHIPLFHYDSIDSFNKPMDSKLIGIEITEGAKNLISYRHPKSACYLLGAEDHGLSKEALSKCDEVVMFDSKFCMNVSCAGSILMWDRFSKKADHE